MTNETHQRKVIMQLELTLDGYGSGPNGEFDWFSLDPEAWELSYEAYQQQIDTVVLGRNNYQGFYGYWPHVSAEGGATETDIAFSRWLDTVPKLVFSRTLEHVEWQNATLLKEEPAEALAALKAQPGKDILIMSSTGVAQACREIIDDYWLTIHPVALGQGVPLFRARTDLTLLDSRVFASGQVFLHYETRRT